MSDSTPGTSPEHTTEWDVIVIGAGPAGEVAAGRVRDHGLTCLILEKHLVGGECSFYACSPSKALLRPIHATHASHRVQGSQGARIVPAEVLARRDAWINDLDDSGMLPWLESRDIGLVRASGRITGERTVEADGRTYTATHAVVLATGSAPLVPGIPGLKDAKPWTNREATTSKVIPRRLAILGGGVVACEMAQVYVALGSEVTVIEMADRLLSRNEPMAGEAVAKSLEEQGVSVRLGTKATTVSRDGATGVVTVELDGGDPVVADELLVAIGRTPASRDLGLDSVGAQTNDAGYVQVSPLMEVQGTSGDQPWLYAVGDLNGISLLTHMGKYQGRLAGEAIAARAAGTPLDDAPFNRVTDVADHGVVPQVTFTDPEVGSVGSTAAQARDAGHDVETVEFDLAALAGTSLLRDDYVGRANLVVDRATDTLLGATFVGDGIAELVHSATVAIVGKVTTAALWHCVPSYPTASEVWLRLLETLTTQRRA